MHLFFLNCYIKYDKRNICSELKYICFHFLETYLPIVFLFTTRKLWLLVRSDSFIQRGMLLVNIIYFLWYLSYLGINIIKYQLYVLLVLSIVSNFYAFLKSSILCVSKVWQEGLCHLPKVLSVVQFGLDPITEWAYLICPANKNNMLCYEKVFYGIRWTNNELIWYVLKINNMLGYDLWEKLA